MVDPHPASSTISEQQESVAQLLPFDTSALARMLGILDVPDPGFAIITPD
jgi:hypothetical protein